MTGRTTLDGMLFEYAIATVALPFGVLAKAHTGWSPFGALIVTRIREPAR
jgi:hypothetical protein